MRFRLQLVFTAMWKQKRKHGLSQHTCLPASSETCTLNLGRSDSALHTTLMSVPASCPSALNILRFLVLPP